MLATPAGVEPSYREPYLPRPRFLGLANKCRANSSLGPRSGWLSASGGRGGREYCTGTIREPRSPDAPRSTTGTHGVLTSIVEAGPRLGPFWACLRCGGRLRLLATIDDRAVIEKIERHLGLPVDPSVPAPAAEPAWLAGSLPGVDALSQPLLDVSPH